MRRSRMFATGCGLVGVAALTAVIAAPPALAAKGPSGSAYALSVATTLLHQPLVKIDPVPTAVYPKGATESLVEVGPNLAGLVTANVLNASATLKGRTQHSAASIADVVVKDILRAEVISAECTSSGKNLTGDASVADLTVLGQKLDTSLEGDIDVLGIATVRINEQIRKGDTLTVNAVHVTIGGPVGGVASADIVLSQAKCATFDGGTEPPTTTTTTTTTRPTQPPTSTTKPTTTTSNTTKPTTKTSTTEAGGIDKVSDDSDLAQTGVSAAVPISLAGLVLLAAGGATMLIARRRRAEKS